MPYREGPSPVLLREATNWSSRRCSRALVRCPVPGLVQVCGRHKALELMI